MKVQSISFIKSYKTFAEAEAWSKMIVGPSFIIHLWDQDGTELFAVCTQNSLDDMADLIASHTDFKTELAKS